MNDFIKLEPQSNVFEAETMIEGYISICSVYFLLISFGMRSYINCIKYDKQQAIIYCRISCLYV